MDTKMSKGPHNDILHQRRKNKGTAFTIEEREKLGITGLLPPNVEDIKIQCQRCRKQIQEYKNDLQKHIYLYALRERNETVFFRFLLDNFEELLPLVYTPTVGEACEKWSEIYRSAQGMYISKDNMGQIRKVLDNWDSEHVDMIVVTDGSRILGLGDLGAGGMGIPIGKSSLYIGAGGFRPERTLPVLLDAGTDNDKLLKDPLYVGKRYKRLGNEEYFKLVDEFVTAVKDKWPSCLIQFEDFSHPHCFDLLEKYENKVLCFNDDIQGTGAVVAAGFINAQKITKMPYKDHQILIVGAGSAGIGVGDALVQLLIDNGVSEKDAKKAIYMVDSKGLITTNRDDLPKDDRKLRFAQDMDNMKELIDVVKAVKPTTLIGLTGKGKTFDDQLLKEIAKINEKPIIFALSNPIPNSECTAEEAYKNTDGKCIFASGSPFEPVEHNGKKYSTGQCNNMYIFPGLGFGAVQAKAKKVTQNMIMASAKALAETVTEEDIKKGMIYPPIPKARDVTVKVAAAVMQKAIEEKVAQINVAQGEKLEHFVQSKMYYPEYPEM